MMKHGVSIYSYMQDLLGPTADVREAVLKFRSRSIWVKFSSIFDLRVPTKSIKTERKNCHDYIYLCVLYIYLIEIVLYPQET